MSAQDDSARDPVRLPAARWAAESPFVDEAAEEEQAPLHPWYQGYTPFVEGRELEEEYAPEAGWESDPAALEAESPLQSAFNQGRTSLIKSEELEEEFGMEEDLRFQRPECLDLVKKITRVAVVGGGLAGLMAARRLSQFGVKVTVFEAYKEVGGRVRSNTEFSNGRITEEGAELIGSFHTKWLGLAQKYGLAVVSRMDPDLYQRAGMDVKLTLDKPLSMGEFQQLEKAMEKRVLEPIAKLAKKQIRDPSRPWQQDELKKYDGMSVQDALPKYCKIAKRTRGNKDERLWKMIEFKLVNDEVAPLDEMNFLGLLCKVRGGQGERFGAGLRPEDMGYWDELEIFRCADGCQRLATEMAAEIKTKPGCRIDLNTKVTSIDILKDEVKLTWVPVRGGKPALGSGQTETFAFVILAIPPSVWDDVIKVDGKNPRDKPGLMSMAPAVKFFSDVKERFWIKKNAAPYGGSLTLGQVWEGTDNQTRVEVEICGPQRRPQKVKQGIVLSVFTGPILPGRRVPTEKQFTDGLKELYPTYDLTPGTGNVRDTRFANWPDEPFIKTGYVSPTKNQIFTIGKELSKPFYDRLFFAGEHTQMAFFGYMEGALRSGERAAHTLMLQACGLLKKPAPKSPSRPPQRPTPKSPSPPLVAHAAPTRETTAFEREIGILSEEYSATDYPGEAESPFLDRDLFAAGAEEEWEPRAAALVAESPFVGALEERRSRLDEDQLEEEEASEELEGEEELEAEEVWERLEEKQLAPWAAGVDPFPATPSVVFNFNDDRMMKAFAPVTGSTVTHLCTALVDLTGDPTTPPYAGLNDKEMIFAGSLPKICAMYAAFALRARVQAFVDAAAANGAPVTPPGITSEIEKAWKPKLRALFPTRPAKSFGNNQDATFPKLGQILTFSPEGKVDFKRATPPLTDAQIDRVGGSGVPEGMFHDWMRSMLRWSNNAAASKCILALGYFYLNGALMRAGLFDAATSKGLWLSADYKGHDWVKTKTDRQANSAGPLLTPRWATVQRRSRSNITATAAQVARFMTLLAQNKLVDATASHNMRALMKADVGGLGSDANDALRRVGRDPTLVIAKFGRGDDGFNHECAIIERTVAGQSLRYVATGLGSAPKRKHQDLFDLLVLLDETIVTRNK